MLNLKKITKLRCTLSPLVVIDPAKIKGQLSLTIYKQRRYVKWPEQYNGTFQYSTFLN